MDNPLLKYAKWLVEQRNDARHASNNSGGDLDFESRTNTIASHYHTSLIKFCEAVKETKKMYFDSGECFGPCETCVSILCRVKVLFPTDEELDALTKEHHD